MLWTISEKSHQRNISMKLFQNLACGFREEDFLRTCLGPYGESSPHSPEPCLMTDQNSRNNFWEWSLKNISVKLFQNLTCSFREEDFLRISSCPYSAKSPHSPEPCLLMGQNFANNFWKGSPKEHSFEIISKSDLQFQRRRFFKNFFMSVQCKKPPFTAAMFIDGSKFHGQVLKRVTQETFLWNYFKIGPAVPEEKIFEELHKKFSFVAMATRVFLFKQVLNRTSQGTFLPNLVQIGQAVWEEKMLKEIVDDAWWTKTTDTGPP